MVDKEDKEEEKMEPGNTHLFVTAAFVPPSGKV